MNKRKRAEERGTVTQSQSARARAQQLDHVFEEVVDGVLPVAEVAAVDVVATLIAPAAVRVGQLERPEEARSLPEVRPAGENLVHQVLHADHVVLLCKCEHKQCTDQLSSVLSATCDTRLKSQ